MISYREKQLLMAQKMLQDESISSLEEAGKIVKDMKVGKKTEYILPERELIANFEELANLAESKGYSTYVRVEDILSSEEIAEIDRRKKEIDDQFKKKTGITNKKDLSFLAIAIALHVAKGLIFPIVAEKVGYGEGADKGARVDHDDKSMQNSVKKEKEKFRDKNKEKRGTGDWIELIFKTPAYDAMNGTANLGLEGKYHRLHTLGHDPILGWVFGTANILTDVMTLDDFRSFEVDRIPVLKVNQERPISTLNMFGDSINIVKDDPFYLIAALFAQAMHIKSDKDTKLGLPVPIIQALSNEKIKEFAGKLYKEYGYDFNCLARDAGVIAGSAAISIFFNLIISLTHSLFYDEKKDHSLDLYKVRTKKILLISNTIGSASNIIYAGITQNPKSLDIGGLLVTISRLFLDIRFITKIKQEFIEAEVNKNFEDELEKLNIEI
ncbi:hypothetical protein [Ohessyouella blattaphilus]|uniref:DUF697 domain-containing protein n=1 Tax=Ohessyouella blattaphilus TaxID=2949333 RepID=A0ABT1EK43_9FIRM|nr:hypothetical protein [Ohessyouella blattaphilus]MCP1110901.1 hypothetical protein [Ohessyouella blattaphilus]MCR8564295.1 hypothetical protein [Ohessyouella blattaphilus]